MATIRMAPGADPMHYGATAAADSSAAFVSASGASKIITLNPGLVYRLTVPAVLPAGTIVEGNGATLQLLTTGGLTLNSDCIVRNVKFSNGNTAGFVGGERAVTIQGSNVTVERCSFLGQDYRHGIVIEKSGGGSCDYAVIRNNKFTNVGYGILKQGGPTGTPTTAHGLKIHDNTFSVVARGDAIGLNAGSDRDILIDGNVIDTVNAAGVTFAGFGIAVAGLTGYAAVEDDRFRRCIISNNVITNVEMEGIHAEVAARVEVRGNHVEQVVAGTRKGTGVGISVYGSINCTVSDNTVLEFSTGILDGIGFLAGSNILSTDRNKITRNHVTNCTTGISEGVSGENKSAFVAGNILTGCATGIKHFASPSDAFYIDNTLYACAVPFNIDANPASKLDVAAATRRIHMRNNTILAANGTIPVNVLANTAGTTINDDALGVVVAAPGGTRYRVSVNDSGAVTTTSL